ncbi:MULTISPECIES: hypothetical protein [Brevibacillus]|uniref:hypothetical protein n=1 Tax=Brevibacillus TaxID=55080 RepID=UPI00362D04E8
MSNNKCAKKAIEETTEILEKFQSRLKHVRKESEEEAEESNSLINEIQALIEQALLT